MCESTFLIEKEGKKNVEENKIIYLDVLFAAELMMNSLVLFLYCKISKRRYRKIFCLLAVLISSFCGVLVIIFACSQSWWNDSWSLFLSCGMAFLELAILQTPEWKGKQVLLEMPSMLLSAFLLAGGLFLFFPQESKMGQSGTLYRRISTWSIGELGVHAVFCAIFVAAGLAVIHIRSKGMQQENLKTVWITLAGKTYTVTAITDTGNNLYDKLSGMPVHIVEEDRIFSEKQKEQMLEKEPERITFVPYSSLGTPHGLLMVIQVEQLTILDNGKKVELRNQKLGLTSQKLSTNNRWQMLLHPDLESCRGKEKSTSPNL